MGLLANEHTMNDTDRHHGHGRVYDPESLNVSARSRYERDAEAQYRPASGLCVENTRNP